MDELTTVMNALLRSDFAKRTGDYGGHRDPYKAFGYNEDPGVPEFYKEYLRGIGNRIIGAPVDKSWSKKPKIYDVADTDTAFNTDIELYYDTILYYCKKIDRISRMGEYGVLYLGYDDATTIQDLEQPVTGARELLFVRPRMQSNANILASDKEKTAHYGMPLFYEIKLSDDDGSAKVHYSRIIHVAEGTLEDETMGIPALLPCYNTLINIEKILGADAEGFFQGAFPGFVLSLKDNARPPSPEQKEALNKELTSFVHDFKRYFTQGGFDIKQLSPNATNPKENLYIQFVNLAAITRQPLRELMGSEKGELSSAQDARKWAGDMESRRDEHCEPKILRQTIDNMIAAGVIAEPKDGAYVVEWPTLLTRDAKEEAETAAKRAEAILKYTSGIDAHIPPHIFYRSLIGFSKEEVDEIIKYIAHMEGSEKDEIDDDDKDKDGEGKND